MNNKNIIVKLFSLTKGMEVYNDIKIIRIKSKKYNLLIMQDYLPVIGDVEGNIDFESDNNSINLENIKGYYMLADNNFSLIIKES
jgi:hypothetical protein